jgi:hypothetical protein
LHQEDGDRPSEEIPLESEQAGQLQRCGARSDFPSTAVNEQFDTRDETAVIRSQTQRHLGNFIGFSHTFHRDCGHYPCNGVCRLPIHNWHIGRSRANPRSPYLGLKIGAQFHAYQVNNHPNATFNIATNQSPSSANAAPPASNPTSASDFAPSSSLYTPLSALPSSSIRHTVKDYQHAAFTIVHKLYLKGASFQLARRCVLKER